MNPKMTTNVIAAILVTMLQTNVVETTNERGCSTCDLVKHCYNIWHAGCGKDGLFGPSYKPATEKTVATTVTEIRKIIFGSESAVLSERVVSTEAKRFVRSEEWKPAGNPYTLEIQPGQIAYTNKILFGIVTNTLKIAGSVTNIIFP